MLRVEDLKYSDIVEDKATSPSWVRFQLMPWQDEQVIKYWKDLRPGDVVVVNLPYEGDTLHLVIGTEAVNGWDLLRLLALDNGTVWVAKTHMYGEAICL